jgi:hypothetical protein
LETDIRITANGEQGAFNRITSDSSTAVIINLTEFVFGFQHLAANNGRGDGCFLKLDLRFVSAILFMAAGVLPAATRVCV